MLSSNTCNAVQRKILGQRGGGIGGRGRGGGGRGCGTGTGTTTGFWGGGCLVVGKVSPSLKHPHSSSLNVYPSGHSRLTPWHVAI